MRPVLAAQLLIVLVLVALPGGPARAATWSIGPNLGFDVLTSNGDNLLIIGVPASSGPFAGFTPGLRIGVLDGTGRNQLFFDTGLQVISVSGSSVQSSTVTANYAYHFQEGSGPYLTAGLGFHMVGFDANTETQLRYGAGVGVRQRLAHGHGAVRFETRLDVLDPTESQLDSVTDFGLRIGFDLDLN